MRTIFHTDLGDIETVHICPECNEVWLPERMCSGCRGCPECCECEDMNRVLAMEADEYDLRREDVVLK